MRNPFKFGCLKPKTKDDDESLLHYPGGGSSKASGLNGYANGNVGGASSTAWQTPPLGKGAMRHLPPYQVQHKGITLNLNLQLGLAERAMMQHSTP
jgi:hypothetical protein